MRTQYRSCTMALILEGAALAAVDDDAAAALRRQNQGMGEPLLALIGTRSERGEVPTELVAPLRTVIWLSARGESTGGSQDD